MPILIVLRLLKSPYLQANEEETLFDTSEECRRRRRRRRHYVWKKRKFLTPRLGTLKFGMDTQKGLS